MKIRWTEPPGARPSGPDGAPEGPWGRRGVPRGSEHQLRTDTEQSSDPSSHVGSCRAKTAFRRVSVGTLFWHDGTRRGSTDRSTGPYRCTIDVRTPWARHGVPTGPLGPRRAPTDPRRTAGGTVGPRFIGASPVWAARSSYRRRPGLSFCFGRMLGTSTCFGMDMHSCTSTPRSWAARIIQVASAAPIGAAGRPNRGGAY